MLSNDTCIEFYASFIDGVREYQATALSNVE